MVMKQYLWLACSLLAAAGTAGCVEQRFIVQSVVPGSPPGLDAGAMVFINGEQKGPAPVDIYYTYYGNYHITLVKDGYQTLQIDQPIPAPWYEWPPLDFITETINPYKVRDVRTFSYLMQPVQGVRPDDVLNRGEVLRDRGQRVMPLPDATPPPPKPAPPPVPEMPPTLGQPRVLPPGS
jgi:hypothetical protein